MTNTEQQARELLAVELERAGDDLNANRVRHGWYVCEEIDIAIRAIKAALERTHNPGNVGESIEALQGISSSLGAGGLEETDLPTLVRRISWGVDHIQQVEAKRTAALIEELSKDPRTTWGQVKSAVLARAGVEALSTIQPPAIEDGEREERLAYERRILATEVDGVKAEKAMREAAADKATSFLVGDPENGVPLRSPMPHEIADAIRALPLRLGNESATPSPLNGDVVEALKKAEKAVIVLRDVLQLGDLSLGARTAEQTLADIRAALSSLSSGEGSGDD